MPLPKQTVNVNFAQGLDTKTDPLQVQPGRFLTLENTVFSKGGLLQKRNGFAKLTDLPDTSNTYLTTFNASLVAIGTSINAFSEGNNAWYNKGSIIPVELETTSLIRSSTNQSQVDTALSGNGTICSVFTDNVPTGSTTSLVYKYVISDATSGQNVIAPTTIVSAGFTLATAPKVFSLGNYFTLVFGVTASGSSRLQYMSINQSTPTITSSVSDVTTSFTVSSQGAFDGIVANNSLYLTWAGGANSGLKTAYLNSTLSLASTKTIASSSATLVSVTADTSGNTPSIYSSAYINGSNSGVIVATDQNLNTLFTAKTFISSGSAQVINLASTAQSGVLKLYYESTNSYSYGGSDSSTSFISVITSTNTGSLTAASVLVRSVGLASKAFLMGSTSYFLSTYASQNQPTYFLINGSGKVAMKLAYQNGGGYVTKGLPSVSVTGNSAYFAYLFKDLIESANKDTNVAAGTQTSQIYTQTGINLAKATFTTDGLTSSEIGSNLNLTGGFVWSYDGYVPVEQNFFVYPDNVTVTTTASGGSIAAQTYYYQATYEWADNQGNIFRSAPSIPVSIIVGSVTSTNTINVPTLRLTYKTANPVKIVLYRWSTGQQSYYQTTSITQPILNTPSVDSISITDTNADATILGNNLLYTTGGVVENVNPPASNAMTLWQSRLWLIDAEDPNLLWYSKTVLESTPVEMSDLFTLFIAPTTGAQGSTGPMTALAALDDKLIIFKENAVYYLNGPGPDATGANGQFSDPIFVTATVGCTNQKSIVFVPQGLMFQSDKGIWLLGRDLSTQYIGAPVEAFNSSLVVSALNIPGTNQVRFNLNSGDVLMYDYYYGQWGTFTNVPAISSTLYKGLHTYINSSGKAFRESIGSYLDGSNPVLMSFTTSWMNLAGLQGFERAYFLYLLATYISPHKVSVKVAYDYNPSATQNTIITPTNFSGAYGADTLYGGGSPYGGAAQREQWRVFLERQKCQAVQLLITEIFDPSLGAPAGAGFTLSGLDLVVSAKGGYPRLGSSNGVG